MIWFVHLDWCKTAWKTIWFSFQDSLTVKRQECDTYRLKSESLEVKVAELAVRLENQTLEVIRLQSGKHQFILIYWKHMTAYLNENRERTLNLHLQLLCILLKILGPQKFQNFRVKYKILLPG